MLKRSNFYSKEVEMDHWGPAPPTSLTAPGFSSGVEKTPKTTMAAAKKVHLDGDVGARASVEMVQGA